MRSKIAIVTVVFAVGTGVTVMPAGAQPPARSYSWYGELVTSDAATRTATVKVQITDPVVKYVNRFKPGDPVVLTWRIFKGDADAVINIAVPDVMKNIDVGYILPVEFVSADAGGKTITVKTAASEAVLATLKSVPPGRWVKVGAPMEQKGPAAVLTSAAAGEKPAPPPKEATADPNAPLPANPKAPTAQLAGVWTVKADLFGNPASSTCTITQDAGKLSGKCDAGPLGSSELSGEVTGNVVKFKYAVTLMGMMLDFAYDGTVDAAAKTMKGVLTVFDMGAPFSAERK